ncbi:MAG: Gfo/Idh/MocA family oxidoreductase [Phycisphaeraceae bacterium JB051]
MYPSIFSDELRIDDISLTLKTIAGWGLKAVDFRNGIFGKPIDSLTDEELKSLRSMLDELGLKTGCLQSSLAKVHLPDADRRKLEGEKLEGLIRAADVLDCRLVRAFNYWQPCNDKALRGTLTVESQHMQQVLDYFSPLAKRAKQAGLILGFENCGQDSDEVLALLDALDEPTWGFAWDPHDDYIMHPDTYAKNEVDCIIKYAKRANMVHAKAASIIDDCRNADVPWDRVLATCAAAGLKGPVSVETHKPKTCAMTCEEASHACVKHIQKNWPSVAPGDIREAAKPMNNQIKRDWESDPVGFVVVGLGMGRNRAKTIAKTPGCKLVGVCDLKEDLAKQVGEEFGVPYTTDLTPWLTNDDVEVVFVLTPTGQHGDLIIDAMRAGKHAMTTKPMEATLAKCQQMIDVADATGKLLAVDFEKRYSTEGRQLGEAVKQGVFGKVHYASAHLRIKRTKEYFDVNGGWHGTWNLDGGGTFSNQCIHHLDELICALGMPQQVRGSLHTLVHDIEAEDLGLGEWRYDNGTVVRVFSTTIWPGSPWDVQLELCGEKGAFVLSEGGPLESGTRWYVNEQWSDKSPVTVEQTWVNSADNMAAAIRTGAPLACDGRQGMLSRIVLEAMYDSARFNEGKWVNVTDVMAKAGIGELVTAS